MKVITKNKTFERHLPSCAIVFNDKKEILMAQRFNPKHIWHKKWNFPGGGIEFGENPKDTAIRETFEEVGIKIEILSDFPIVLNYFDKNRNEDSIGIVYIAKYVSGNIDVNNDEGTADAKWFNIKDLNFDECLPLTKDIIEIANKFIN